ncbi:hypothetical protein BDM02DRAFT_1694073 [Thelephora ganbajun]|uniref:Uncharacterized protein n=1 Tax=Thelephora ganbajun TaxID=370292 RepID=A0ACB6Z0V0_THEGA|nr:hypothetical protein BDM02DRAFT_1694073 [Thelephora ganbajun]
MGYGQRANAATRHPAHRFSQLHANGPFTQVAALTRHPMILHNPLQQLHDLDRASPQFYEQLSSFLRGNEYRNVFPKLQSEDFAWLVEYLDSVLVDVSDPTGPILQECLHELGKICGVKELLPKSCTLSDSLLEIGPPSASGCVYEGTLDGSKETFHQVAVTWKRLTHRNIVPLLGVTIDPLQLIGAWISGLNYLHSCNVIHGDLKGTLVLLWSHKTWVT